MSIFMICGIDDCPNFAHACRAAEHLQKYLPKFTYLQIKKTTAAWHSWLTDLNQTNEWCLATSPVIWKCITRTGGKPYLIGGLSEFWEYVYDYYGFQSLMPRSDLEDLVADNKMLSVELENKLKIIGISGVLFNPITPFLLYELDQAIDEELHIRLYQDQKDFETEDHGDNILDIAQEFSNYTKQNPNNINIALTREELIRDCDLLIILDDYSKDERENTNEWLTRCRLFVSFWAEDINAYAKRHVRVVFSQEKSLACFNATVLIESCTNFIPTNVVAVTADEGIAMIDMVSQKTQVPVREMGCPPVWGIPGLASFVDLESTVIKASVFRPFERAVVSKDGAKLPQGQVYEELRLLSYVLSKHDANDVRREAVGRNIKEMENSKRTRFLPRVRAIGSLLKLWFAKNPDDDIISLGVCSNGSFGFPTDIVFSQPVKLDPRRGIWVPFTNFPLSEMAKIRIGEVITECKEISEMFCKKEPTEDEKNCSLLPQRLSEFRV